VVLGIGPEPITRQGADNNVQTGGYLVNDYAM